MFVRSLAIALSLVVTGAGIASAQTKKPAAQATTQQQAAPASSAPTRIQQFQAWGAYSYKSGASTVCYVLSVPTEKKPANIDHGENFFIVSQRPGQNISYEPQAMMGYTVKDGSKIEVVIDNKTFVMFTKDKAGWVENAAQEPALVAAMKGGHSMTVNATSRKGTATSYSYSLSGISASLKQIEACK
jgi:invasion protein IalB